VDTAELVEQCDRLAELARRRLAITTGNPGADARARRVGERESWG